MSQTKLVLHNTQTKKLTNTAQVTANEYPVDVQTTRTTVIPYLSVSITDNPEPVQMEGNLHYDFDVALSSNAPKAATGVELVTKLPNGVELQSVNSKRRVGRAIAKPTILLGHWATKSEYLKKRTARRNEVSFRAVVLQRA
jgi:hypothetical protein